jgi:transcriptional regulator with XRE-family HTH domain
MAPVARFGDNLRAFRKTHGLSQKELAGRLRKEDGADMQQAHISKLEAMEWSPKPETVRRLAEGLARISGASIQAEFDRLLDGVSSRFDAVQARRAIATDPVDRLRALVEQLPADKRADLVDALERYAAAAVKATERRGA